jgi:hypothetical protein
MTTTKQNENVLKRLPTRMMNWKQLNQVRRE